MMAKTLDLPIIDLASADRHSTIISFLQILLGWSATVEDYYKQVLLEQPNTSLGGAAGFGLYEYRIQRCMDSEIRAIMAQYMPLDNQGGEDCDHLTEGLVSEG